MRLEFTDEIYKFLDFAARESIIAQILLQSEYTQSLDNGTTVSFIKDEGNYISKFDNDHIEFLPVSKYEKSENPWSQYRTKLKIGRFIRKFFTEFSLINFKINDRQIERFVNLYKSYFTRDISRLRIVEGDELKSLYSEVNYHAPNGYTYGTLWNSCMRQVSRNKYLSLYSKNSDDIKMLVYFSEDGKVRARALLWQNVKEHGSDKTWKLMDRIYYVYDHDVDFFKDWAAENGYICKSEQNAKTEFLFDIDSVRQTKDLYVILPIHLLSYAPYLDTFKYYDPNRGRFSNSSNFSYSFVLVQSDGNWEREPQPEEEDAWDEDN